MAKDKKMKIEYSDREMIDAFTRAVDDEVKTGSYARFHTFEEVHTKSEYCKSAILDYGKYKIRLYYNPQYMFGDYLDFRILLGGKYEYSIYDVFNLFDIKDFNQYYYSDLELPENVCKAVKKSLETISKYDYDFSKAAERTAQLDENVEKDYKTTFPKDEEESWREDANSLTEFNVIHPYFTSASSATDSDKLLKRLRKADLKNNLTTIYEKRLLEYLEQGNKVVNENYIENLKQLKAYGSISFNINALIFVAVAVLYALMIIALRYVSFSGAYVPTAHSAIGSLSIPISLEAVIVFVMSVVITVPGISSIFTKSILKKIASDDAANRYEKEMFGNKKSTKLRSIFAKGAGVLLIVIGFVSVSIGFSNIGFYDDSIKFNDLTIFDTYEIKNEDLKLVRVLGEYDDNDEYSEYTDSLCYLFCDDSENYYQLANINPDGETAKRIDDIIKKYNITVEEVKSIAEYTDVEEQ